MDFRLAVFLFITSFIEIFSEIVSIKDFPYQVLLKYKNVPFCGGSVISNRHVLSAAHCVFGKSKNFPDMTVHTGTTYITDDSTAYFIYRVDIHPKFTGKLTKPYVYCNDIAVITLKTIIEFGKNTNKIDLAKEDVKNGDSVTLSGWGITTFSPKPNSNDLMSNKYEIITNTKCSAILSYSISNEQFCSFSKKEISKCAGDSGGPIVKNGKLIGVASHAVICQKNVPDIYTSVYHSLIFIKSIISM